MGVSVNIIIVADILYPVTKPGDKPSYCILKMSNIPTCMPTFNIM